MRSARRCLSTLALCSSLACAGAPIVPRLGVSLPPWPGGPMLVPQIGHAQRTKALAWAPDGRTFATGGEDGRVIVWDAAIGAVRASFRAAAGQGVEAVAISPDGALVATSGGADFTHDDDPSVRVWDAATGALRHVLVEHRESVFGLAFASDGRLATAGKDGKVCLFDAALGRALGCGGPRRIPGFLHWLKGDTEWAVRVAFTADGGLAVTYAGGAIERYDASLSSLGFTAVDDHSVTTGMSTVLAGAAGLAANLSGGSLVVWSLAGAEPTRAASVPVPCDAYTSPCTLAFSPDGRTLALVRREGVELFDAATLARRHSTLMAADGWGVAGWSADGAHLAFSTPKGFAIVDAKGALVHAWSPAVPRDRQVAFSPDGKLVLTSSGAWDLASGTFRAGAAPVGTFPVEERIAAYAIDEALVHADYVAPPGPPRLAHGGSDRIVALDASGAPIGVFAELEDMVFALATSRDGTRVVAGDSDGRVYLFDAATRRRLWVRTDQSGYLWGVAFDRDGQRLASIDANGTVLVRDASNGAELKRYHLPGHWGASGLAFSPDGRFLAVAAASIRVFRLVDDAELVLQVLPVDGRTAPLAMTEAGLFAGSDLAFSKVVFRVGPDLRTAELLSADQLFEQFHRPSLVADFFAGLTVAPSREALDVTGAPAVELVEALPAEAEGDKLRVRVRGLDRGAGVSEIRVFANGARVGGWPATAGDRGLKAKMVADVEVTLAPGDNVITAEAYSVRGRLRSPRLERVVRAKASAPAKPRLFIVSVALDDYADPAQPLSYAKADGAAVTAAFATQRGRLFEDVLATSVVDRAATREAFEAALTDVATRALPSDVFVLYAAGHGLMVQCPGDEEARYHLLTYRASLRSEPTICQHGVSDRRLAELVRAVPARKKLVVLDTCQAGAAATEKTLVAMRGAVEIDAIKRLARAEGVAIVAAAKAAEYAGEVPALGHGIFTYALVQGLAGRAAVAPGPVSVFGLLGYLQSEVPALSEQHFGRPQFPITSLQGQDFPLSIMP